MADGLCVLVAHYDGAQIESMRRTLEDAGAEVVTASSGEQAVAEATRARVDLALVATLLPGTHGFEVCRQLSAASPAGDGNPPVSVVLLSDVEDPYIRARARHVGAKQVVLEPMEDAVLRSLLAVQWSVVDPLDLPRADSISTSNADRLLKDLLDPADRSQSPDPMRDLTDSLTGLASEEYTSMKIDEEAKRASRYKLPLSLLIAEIDDLDQLVAKHGSTTADEVALEVAGVFLCESRDVDVVGRSGDRRFYLLMPNTPESGAAVAAERFRESLADKALFIDDEEVEFSVSLGVSTRTGGEGELSRDRLIAMANDELRLTRAGPRR